MTGTAPAEWTARELNERVERGDRFAILDVRNRDEFEAARIEGRSPIPTTNVPYFEMLEGAGDDEDLSQAVLQYARANLDGSLPKDTPLLTVCAKGGTSRLVAGALRELGYDVTNLSGGTAAWGDFYAKRTAATEAATITQFARSARGCLSYLVDCDGIAAVIDPGRHIEPYLDAAAERTASIRLVIDTHAHADHVSGGPALAARTGATYHLHPYDAIHPIDLLPARLRYAPLLEGMTLGVGSALIEPLWIPGHTLGNLALLVAGRYLLSGDSIFILSVARPDLGGRPETWTPLHYESLRRLLALPDSTLVLPGHFSRRDEADAQGVFAATLGALKKANDGLREAAGTQESFGAYIARSLPTFPPEYVDIKRINAGLLQVSDEQLAELETGKNQCAMGGRHE